MFHAYIIKSLKTAKYYTGSTGNLPQRLINHNIGLTKTTKNKGPFVLIYKEEFSTRSEAVAREKVIKSYHGGEAFKKLVE